MKEIIIDQKIISVFSDFVNVVAESGFSNTSHQFSESLESFTAFQQKPFLNIVVCYFQQTTTPFLEKSIEWVVGKSIDTSIAGTGSLNTNGPVVNYSISRFENIISSRIGQIPPVVLFLIIDRDSSSLPDLAEKLLAYSLEYPYIAILTEDAGRLPEDMISELKKNLLCFELLDFQENPVGHFGDRLENEHYLGNLNRVLNHNCLKAIDSFYEVLGLMIDQEERILKAKQASSHHQIIEAKLSGAGSAGEVYSKIRRDITDQITSIDKSICENFDNYLRPKAGDFSIKVEEILQSLPQLNEVQKAKTTALLIPDDYIKFFLDSIYQNLLQTGHEQLITIRDSFKALQLGIESYSENHHAGHIPLNFRSLTDQQLVNMLNGIVRIDKSFEGSLPKQGIMEYFTALKKYQSILLMFISSFGLYFVKSIEYIMIPVTIILLGICVFFIYKSVQQENKEGHEREFEKAKEMLRNESRRIAQEIQKQWTKVISEHLKQQMAQSIACVEAFMKEMESKKNATQEEENKRIQRQNIAIENTERKIMHTARLKENFLRSFERLKSEFDQHFTAI